jgi:DNA invertase Pin-like site-specific DNA recombinase
MIVGQRIGYIRVSSEAQNLAMQEQALGNLNLDRVFADKASGKDLDRPQLQAALSYCRAEDEIIIYSMDRLSRSLRDLISVVKQFTDKKVKVTFIKESLTFNGDDSPMSNLILGIMGSLAEWERAVSRERQMAGIAIAKENGMYKGRKPSLNDAKKKELNALVAAGTNKTAIAKHFGISRQTLYSYLNNNTRH